jgi:hypothetical protein
VYCIPLRIESFSEGILPANHSFQCGERLILLQNVLFTDVVETHVPFEENDLCPKQEHLAHRLPVRTELGFERNTSCKS